MIVRVSPPVETLESRPISLIRRLGERFRALAPAQRTVVCFLGLFVAYQLNFRVLAQIDCVPAPYLAWSLVERGSFDLSPYAELSPYLGPIIEARPDGTWLYIKPPGSALLTAPFVAPMVWAHGRPLAPSEMAFIGKIVASFYVAASVLVFHWLMTQVAPNKGILATLLFAFGTSNWSTASQALWTHGPAVFAITLAAALLFSSSTVLAGVKTTLPSLPSHRWRWPNGIGKDGIFFPIGLCLGMSVVSRQSAVFFAIATLAMLLYQRRGHALLWTGLGLAGPVLLFLAYNQGMFGSALGGGYTRELAQPSRFVTPWYEGTLGLLLAPSRGLFVYSPALLLAPLALVMTGPQRIWLLSWTGAVLTTVLFYSTWHDWKGGWCFGPRFLAEAIPFCCLLFGWGIERQRGRLLNKLVVLLVALSITIHAIGVFGYCPEWHARQDAVGTSALFTFTDTQISAYFFEIFP